MALAGVGTVTMGTGISFGAIGSSIAAAIGAITPVGWAIIGTVVVVSVVAIAVNYAQSETKSDSKERITSPIGRRNNYNSRKDAKEAAKKAGGGKDPIKHSKGSHGNKRSHYHPNVKNKYRITPHGPSLHDHYYYPG